jgi:dihydrodipicolinate synthase/N-acetylneuraminate lyase
MAKTNKDIFGQVLVALVTPMTPEGEVDWASTEKHIDYVISNGADGVVVTGTTGETSTLTDAEKIKLVEVGKSVASGRAKIITGGGSNETAHAMQLYKQSEKAGADGVMIVTPYYNKPTQAGILTHFRLIADATDLPVILYESPYRFVKLLEEVAELPGDREVFAGRELTKKFEECRVGSAAQIKSLYDGRTVKGELVVVIGPSRLSLTRNDETASSVA